MVETTSDLTAANETRDLPRYRLIQRLADNKYWLGRRYAEWCTAAPTLESAVAAAAMAQDEIGHARSLYPLFRQLAGHDVEPEDISDFHNMAFLDEPFLHWTDFVTANFLVDSAISVLLRSAISSTYDDLRNRAKRITGEEEVHWLHGRGWIRRLTRGTPELRDTLQIPMNRSWPEVLMWFGPSDSVEMRELHRTGVLSEVPDGLRDKFLLQVQPVLRAGGLQLEPSQTPSDPSVLPWSRWDAERYRLTS
jgi:phenylacetate-CoA oxygenase PaaI subunit